METEAAPGGPHRMMGPLIAGLTLVAIGVHLCLRFAAGTVWVAPGVRLDQLPLIAALVLGGAR